MGRAGASVLGLVLVVACSGSPTDLSATDPLVLDNRSALANCLTHLPNDSGADEREIVSDLCRVNVDTGAVDVIRHAVKGGSGPAVSPTRDRAAFVADGALRVVRMDGSHDTVVGRDGLEPQWINEHTVAIVTNDHQQIVTIDMAHQNAEAALFSVTDGVDLGGPSDIDSFAWHEPSQTLVVSLFRRDWQTNVSDAYALVVVDARGARTLAGPSDTPWVQPAFHPDGGRLLVATIRGIQLMDVASGAAEMISPAQWYGVTPSWSPDGNEVLWLANGVGGPIGPAVLIRQPYANQQVQGQPTLVVGNHQESLHQFPAYPAWT